MDFLSECCSLKQILQFLDAHSLSNCLLASKNVNSVIHCNWKRMPKLPIKMAIFSTDTNPYITIAVRPASSNVSNVKLGRQVKLMDNAIESKKHHPYFLKFLDKYSTPLSDAEENFSVPVGNFREEVDLVLDGILCNANLRSVEIHNIGDLPVSMFRDIIGYFRDNNIRCNSSFLANYPGGTNDPLYFEVADALDTTRRVHIYRYNKFNHRQIEIWTSIRTVAEKNTEVEIVVKDPLCSELDLIPTIEMEDRKDFDMDAVMKHMEASYCQQATKEKEELMLRKRGRGKEVESAKPDWNRHMAVKMERKLGEDVTSYCHCGHCAKLPYDSLERENFCCMDECMARPTTWNKNLTDILKAHKISCITEWESFNKIVIEREVLFSHLQYSSIKHREKRMKRSELDNKSLRYVACNVYTSLVHGEQLGYGVRLELPCCVRTRIIQAFPEENGQYSRFEAVNGEDHTLSDFERNVIA